MQHSFNNYRQGQAMIIGMIFFVGISLSLLLGVATPTLRDTDMSRTILDSRQGLYTAESGVEDVVYRIASGKAYDAIEVFTVGSTTATTTATAIVGGIEVFGTSDTSRALRNMKASVIAGGSGVAFHYGVQVGAGGIILNNTSIIRGNAYSNGPITGENRNYIYGDVVSAGPTGLVDGVHATGTVYAHTIRNSTIDRDAYYGSVIQNTTVSGALFPNSPDQATSTLPIADEQITEWETEAAAGGTLVCNNGSQHTITSSVTLGPKKIPCDLNISNNAIVTLAGPLWVTGNITFSNSAILKVSPSLPGITIPLIADNTANQTSSSQIFVSNSATFQGAGTNSYIILISQNKSAETGGGTPAIQVSNSVQGEVLVYAAHGLIQVSNSVDLREITAYQIRMNNSSEVIYKTGLANLVFTSGPGGGVEIQSWKEVE